MIGWNFKSFGSRLLLDRKGNFGIMTAFLLPILIVAAGISMDYAAMMKDKAKMRDASDAAAMAAASAMAQKGVSEAAARDIATRFLKAHSLGDFDFYSRADIVIVTTQVNKAKTFKVTIKTSYDYPVSTMTAFTGIKIVPIVAKSTATSTQEIIETKYPASLFLVLDRSGSMGDVTDEVARIDASGQPVYRQKITSLKLAVARLGSTLKAVDPDWNYVRMGAVGYSETPTTPLPLDWGTSKTQTYANALTPAGGTNPVAAIKIAETSLTAASENAAHLAKNGKLPTKFILFLTDGENNPRSLDRPAMANCTAAKAAGIEIYTVGFMVPNGALPFLKGCATDANHFFNVTNASALYAAFEKIGASTMAPMANRVTE